MKHKTITMSTDLIKKLANDFVEAMKHMKLELSFDKKSVGYLDLIVENSGIGPESNPDEMNRIIEVMGSFLGETMAQTLGLKWEQRKEDGQWVLVGQAKNGDKITANPFNKVYKRFINGKEDSISYYYVMIEKTLNGELQV